MKEVKFLLTVLASVLFTSGWWAVGVWHGIRVGGNAIPIGALAMTFASIGVAFAATVYCQEHWNDK